MAKRSESVARLEGRSEERRDPGITPRISSMTVSLGSDKFQPQQYNSFEVPGLTVTVELREDDDPVAVFRETHKALSEMQEDQFRRDLDTWCRRYAEVRQRARRG